METLIYFDKSSFERDVAQFNANLPHMQSVVDTYNKMQLPALNNEDFLQLFTETESVIFDKMTGGEAVSIAGLKVDKAKAFEILHKPDGYENFTKALEVAISDLREDIGNSKSVPAWQVKLYYELSSEGKVVLKQSFIEKMEEMHKRYAKTELANKVLEYSTFVIDKLKELGLETLAINDPNGFTGFIRELIEVNNVSKQLQIKTRGILEYNNK